MKKRINRISILQSSKIVTVLSALSGFIYTLIGIPMFAFGRDIMKHILITTIAAVLLVGCGESQQSAPAPEVKPAEPVAEASQPEPQTAKAPDIDIHGAAAKGNIEAVKQHIAAGTNVNSALRGAAKYGQKEIAELLIANGADVNAKNEDGFALLDHAILNDYTEITDLLRKHGGKTSEELNDTAIIDLLHKHGGKTKRELEAAGK